MLGWLVLAAMVGLTAGIFIGLRRPSQTLISSSTLASSPILDQAENRHFAEAVRSLPMGLILASETGEVVYRNAYAWSFETGPRITKALVRGHVNDLLKEAMNGRSHVEEVDVFGPPRLRLRFSGRPVIEGDRQVGAVVVISDITEEYRIDAVRRDFVANVSHELKTPVGAMGVLAEALAVAQDRETVLRLTDRIQTAAFRLGETVDDLLTLSAIEAADTFATERIDLKSLLVAGIQSSTEAATVRNVKLAYPETGSAEHIVLGDRVQLASAVNNLISNAIKYSDVGGEVLIDVVESDDWVEIRVSDNGIGIPQFDQERIFERFYRVDTARSRKTGGTGLGLSIVRHVALNHGGTVHVESQEGKGSVFTIRLPHAGSGR